MSSQSVEPLRIQKSNPSTSPTKFNGASHRPLTELSPMAIRRNSPSFPGGKGKIFKSESSPFNSSPQNGISTSSPHLFWRGRDPSSPARENQSPFDGHSPAPAKRSSIENLMKASRVKNSSMFAREQNNNYDPSNPSILDRPLASGRPLSMQFQGNAFGGQGMAGISKENGQTVSPEVSTDSKPIGNTFSPPSSMPQLSPSKSSMSPAKSSLSKRTGANARNMGFDPEMGIWEDEDLAEKKLPEGRVLHRHAKSVTFDQAPPQINEYEMTTPDPSSVASGSRENSYDSGEEDEDISFERGSSYDREDSFDASLEDTEKTPVVLPEDWRFMSPDLANTELAQHEEDVFDDEYGSPAPNANPGSVEFRPHQSSLNSVDSNGQTRPLPPLPSMSQANTSSADPRDSLSGTIERMSNAQRFLPSPPQAASISKSDIRRMSGGSFSLEERFRIMALQEQEDNKSEAERQRERRMRRAGSKDPSPTREPVQDPDQREEEEEAGSPGPAVVEYDDNAPRISRESILRRLRSQQDLNADEPHDQYNNSMSDMQAFAFDPDVPIPSLEDPTQTLTRSTFEREVIIKEEEIDDNGLYSIPDMYAQQSDTEDEATSEYSQASLPAHVGILPEEGQETPRAHSPIREPGKKSMPLERMSLPDFTDFGEQSSFDLGLDSYMTPPTEQKTSEKPLPDMPIEHSLPDLDALRQSIQRPFTPEEQLEPPCFSVSDETYDSEPGTPGSVIRHPVVRSPLPEVTEPEATVKAPGTMLKTRPSITPLDAQSMAATRRQVSGQMPGSPPIPERHHQRPSLTQEELQEVEKRTTPPVDAPEEGGISVTEPKKRISSLVQLDLPRDQSDENLGFGLEKEFDRVVEAQKVAFELSLQRLYYPFNGRFPSSELPDSKDSRNGDLFHNAPVFPKPLGARALPGDRPARGHIYPNDGLAFANRHPYRQRGYLMRQNTKIVIANERMSQDEPRQAAQQPGQHAEAAETPSGEVQISPRKISQPTWTAEPWDSKSRRKSIRMGGEKSPTKRKPVAEGPAPPLPGQASNVQDGLGALVEDELAEEEAEDFEDGAERGRLFVKVVGVKALDLPLPNHERTSFALTLDNGLHCVTTAWLDLGRSAPIGQEFELVVLNDLEFQLTLQMKMEEPKLERPQSPTKPPGSPTKKTSTFGRLFGSPKKKREAAELLARQQDAATRPITPPSAYEMVQGLVAKDGSFARAYVALSEHEKQAYGRPYAVDVVCFNEWALEEVQIGSSRSKKSTQMQRRPPYPIGKLELQLLYIPKPKGARDEDMPKSMNGAVRELRDAESRMAQQIKEFEGHLSQQGGDCPYWRRRFFKLVGTKLTAYHESTLQPRATINLAKASKLIDDKSSLTQKETSTKGGGRRKSAFAEEEEGYMFVEEGFRIRFANGEVIDFYADSPERKDEWMQVLTQIVGKGAVGPSGAIKPWAEAVLKREKSVMTKEKKTKGAIATPARPLSGQEARASRNAPNLQQGFTPSPTKAVPRAQGHARTESHPPQSGSRSQTSSPVKNRDAERHRKAKSMQWH